MESLSVSGDELASRRADAVSQVVQWFAEVARPLPWRDPTISPWAVLVSEVMLQQTPTTRVIPVWTAWLQRWPDPAALAQAPAAEVLRMWGRLGYPRRALRLQATAAAIVERHDGQVPETEDELLVLPGVGSYTAAAVMAFAFGRRSLVLDVNVRRVLARWEGAVEHPSRSETAAERRRGWLFVPDDDATAAAWAASSMELGALVCTARSPQCHQCPISSTCAWVAAGKPTWEGPVRTAQSWEGTDRQCRGRVMATLRASTVPVAVVDLAWPDADQLARCVDSLVADGLAQRAGDRLTLPH